MSNAAVARHLPDRWFIWTMVLIVVVGISVWGYIQYSVILMDIELAGFAQPIE